MLFDIRGRRRRFIQVIYVFLALLLGGGLVFFGIGGDAPGGLGDALGLNGGHSGTGSTGNAEFDNQIEGAEETLEANPEDERALLTLARYEFLAGQQQLEQDEQGLPVVTEEAQTRFESSIDAWQRYMETDPKKPDDNVATLMFQAYGNLSGARTDPVILQRDLEGAVEAAEIVAEARPSPNSFLQLATAAYYAGETKLAEQAADDALSEVDHASRSSLESQLDSAKRQGKAIQRQLEAAAPGQDQLEDPFGGISPGGAGPGG